MELKTKQTLANIVIAFGIIGFLFSAYILFSSFGESSLPTSVEEQFTLMSQSMQDASVTASNAAVSIRSAKSSLESASKIVSETSSVATSLADAININILGITPLDPAAQMLKKVSTDIASFSTDLTSTASHLEQNADDINKLSEDFKAMSEQLSITGEKLTGFTPGLNFTWIGIYLCVLHGMFIAIGFLVKQ
ncbi:hypothetical protein J4457_04565 [Candidatus Woesearchaeota archaeon]|nr:hypothetical protein [Candidatus Woesearchaeota archaeon]